MSAGRAIHVRFTRPVDPSDALPSLAAHGLTAVADRERSELAVGCAAGDEERVLAEVTHALDAWLLERRLPFAAVRIGKRTLVVRPPADP